MPLVTLKNRSKSSPRVVRDIRNRAVTINPGQSKEVNLTDAAIARLVKINGALQVGNLGTRREIPETSQTDDDIETGGEDVTATGGEDAITVETTRADANAGAGDDEDAGDDTGDAPRTAAQLIIAFNDGAFKTNYNQFVEEAKKTLGSKWPGGNVKKATIIQLLNQQAAEGN